MHKIISTIIFTVLCSGAFSQSSHEKFEKLFKANDTTKIKSLLADWEKANPNDPELYTSAINFYFSLSQEEVISVSGRNSGEGFKLTDSSGNVAGYLNSETGFNAEPLAQAIKYATAGIEKFPDRLDIRFGKCYVLQQTRDYGNFTTELIKTIEYSQVNKNNWLWAENKKQAAGERFMLDAIQSYLKQLYDTEDDALLPNMIQIGEAALKYYNNVEILSTTSVALMLTKEYDKAIGYLKQAERTDPKDFIVLNNIAQGYKLKGDKLNAIKYYELTEKYGDADAKRQAGEHIKALRE